MQDTSVPAGRYLPAGQGWQEAKPLFSGVNLPATHLVHTEAEVPPTQVEYVPAGHGVQLVAPRVAEYVPRRQDWQVDDDIAPVELEYLPIVQGLQVCDDVAWDSLEYLPAGHAVQETEPAVEYFPASQMKQVPSDVPPLKEDALPAGQLVQVVAPA